MKRFKLEIGELQFDDTECQYRDLYIHFVTLWNSKSKHLLDEIEDALKTHNLYRVNEVAEETFNECVSDGVIPTLLKAKIFSYDLDTIQEEYDVCENWEEAYGELESQFDEINLQNQKEQAYRDYRKASRGRWVGGGFGVTGALKGAATAAVFNGITGTAHSLGNAVGNAYSNYKANQKLQKLFEQNDLAVELCAAIGKDVKNLVDILVDILNKNGMNIKEYTTVETNIGIRIYNNYDKIENYEDKKEALKQCIKSNPYDPDFGILYLEDFYKGYERDREFDALCSYFGMDIESMKSQILFNRFRQYFSLSDSEKIRCLEEYLKTATMWKVTDTTKKDVEYCFKEVDDIELDIDHVKCVSEELREKVISKQYFKVDTNISAQFFQRLFLECKYPLVNGEEVEADNAKETIDLLRAKLEIIDIYKSCDIRKKSDIVAAIEKINNCNEKYNNTKIGYKVLNYMKYGAAVSGVVFDPMIEHENLKTDIENFKGGRFVIAPILTLMENGEIKYPDNYSNRIYNTKDNDEKGDCDETIEIFQMEYEKIDFSNEDALISFNEEVQKFKNKTGLGDSVISELGKRLEYIDKCERTVLGVEYPTREEAEKEKKKVAGNHKYETVEEAETAKKELKYIDDIIGTDLASTDLIKCFINFQNLKKYNICTPTGRDKMTEIEKSLIERYKRLCEEILSYEKNKSSLSLWKIVSVIGTMIAIPFFFSLGIIGKIICICIVCALWQTFLEKSAKCKSFDLNSYSIKESIDKFTSIQNESIQFRETSKNGKGKNIRFCTKCGTQLEDNMIFCPVCGEKLKNN